MKNFLSLRRFCFVIIALLFFAGSKAATTYDVTSYATLTVAVTAATNGDIINFKDHIVVITSVAVSKSLTFQGNGYTITVLFPASAMRVYTIRSHQPSTYLR